MLHGYLSGHFFFVQFSLPLPQGGREAIAKNLVLREDQLPQKFLYPKTKKKINKQVIFPLYGGCCFCLHTGHCFPTFWTPFKSKS